MRRFDLAFKLHTKIKGVTVFWILFCYSYGLTKHSKRLLNFIAELYTSQIKSPPPIINDSNVSFYEGAYAKATSEQKIELDKIIADKSIGLPGEWRRPVLIAIGDLPKDQPRLTAEQAGEIYDRIGRDEGALEKEFNIIAGAPDFVGGSGIERSVYYLNDDRSEAIFLTLGDATLYTVDDDGIYNIRLPLGNQKLPVGPGTSLSPFSNTATNSINYPDALSLG
jgi:hypothetical protein